MHEKKLRQGPMAENESNQNKEFKGYGALVTDLEAKGWNVSYGSFHYLHQLYG